MENFQFSSINNIEKVEGNHSLEVLYDIPVEISIKVGETELTVEEILKLTNGSIVELDTIVGEPCKIYANNVLIGYGEIIVVNDNLGIKIIKLVPIENIIDKL